MLNIMICARTREHRRLQPDLPLEEQRLFLAILMQLEIAGNKVSCLHRGSLSLYIENILAYLNVITKLMTSLSNSLEVLGGRLPSGLLLFCGLHLRPSPL